MDSRSNCSEGNCDNYNDNLSSKKAQAEFLSVWHLIPYAYIVHTAIGVRSLTNGKKLGDLFKTSVSSFMLVVKHYFN